MRKNLTSKKSTKRKEKIDLVCGMDISDSPHVSRSSYRGKSFYFCSKDCKMRFKRSPKKFQGTPIIRLNNVWKVFNMGDVQTEVLRGVSLNIWEGDFVALIGASGSGKSTSLNMVGLLDRQTSGEIYINGKDTSSLTEEERSQFRSQMFGFVFQQYNLIPWLTAYENIALPLIFSEKEIEPKSLERHYKKIGLSKRITHRPFELSGGEQQRVALLRALANDPEIIIGDEPTGNLDSSTGEKILKLLIDLNKVQNKTLIIVTHDAAIAKKADQIIVLKDGQVKRDHHVSEKMYTE